VGSNICDVPRGAVCNLVWRPADRRILLIKKRPHKFEGGLWGCPGGKQEYGETSGDAARRELGEECGSGLADASAWYGPVAVVDDVEPEIAKHYITVVHFFIAPEGAVAQNAEPEHHEAVGWFPPVALPLNGARSFNRIVIEMNCRRGFRWDFPPLEFGDDPA
jgi:8-oxo-dGTP diphosphatase